MPREKPTVTVIVPALNEEQHVRDAVAEVEMALAGRFSDWELLLFDDGSTDRTGAIMDELAAGDPRIRVVHNPSPRNLGGVYKQGVQMARFEYVVMVPGDNENPASALVGPFDAVGTADIVLPYPINATARSPLRNALSRGYTELLNALFGLEVPYYNGTVVHRTDNVRDVEISTDSFAYQGEALIRLLREGKTFRAVGIAIVPRPGRKSKALRAKNVAGVLLTLSRLAFSLRARRSREARA